MEDRNERYAYLLQPIRDLQKNWDVDIAKELDTYMEELRMITEEQDMHVDNAHKVNFAEAAALIQGSSGVYGKKVDIVFMEAEGLKDKLCSYNKKKKKNSPDEDGDGGDDGDDVEEADLSRPCDLCSAPIFLKQRKVSVSSASMAARARPAPTISVVPMSLMPLSEYEKCNVPMFARKKSKEIIGKKDDFKINTAYVDPTGSMLLDLRNRHLISLFTIRRVMSRQEEKENIPMEMDDQSCAIPDPPSGFDVRAVTPLPMGDVAEEKGAEDEGAIRPSDVCEMDRDAMARVTGVSLPAHTLLYDPPPSTDNHHPDDVSYCAMDIDDGGIDMDQPDVPADDAPLDPWDDPENDPVRFLDHYANDQWMCVPFKTRNTAFNMKAMMRKHKKEIENKSWKEKLIETVTYMNEYVIGKKKKRKTVHSADQWTETIARLIGYKKKSRKRKRGPRIVLADSEHVQMQQVNDDLDASMNGGDMGDDIFDPPDPVNGPPLSPPRFGQQMDEQDMQLKVMGGLSLVVNEHSDHLDLYDRPDSRLPLDEQAEFYVRRYWATAESLTSELAKRVTEWETVMIPKLEEEEHDKEFDIHEYGDRVLAHFEQTGQKMPVDQLLAGVEQREVSRYLLSMLMMANTMNVHIHFDENVDSTMELTLLKRERHHEIFDQDGAL